MFYAVVVGAALFALGFALNVLTHQEGLQLIIYLTTSFIIGFVAVGIKRGFILTLILVLIYANSGRWVISSEIFNDLNVVAAVFLTSLMDALLGAALEALGGFLGRRD